MSKQKMKPHNIDVQMVADMLERDKCPASMGCFDYPDGTPGMLLIMAPPAYEKQFREFLASLYEAAGYVSPTYPSR